MVAQRAAVSIPLGVSSRIRWPVALGLSGEIMTPTANLASTEVAAEQSAAPAAEAGPFVLNLCSSTTPMALAQTDMPELKRFTFFVSRRFEEGRERFRLHMGFFASQAEAEEWLSAVRDIYPGAWAGEAPGKKLRARAAEAAAAQAGHAVGPQKTAAPAPMPTPAAPVAARPQGAQPAAPSKIPTLVPTLQPPAPMSARAVANPAVAPRAAVAPPPARTAAPSRTGLAAKPAPSAKAALPAKAAPPPKAATQPPVKRPVAATTPPRAAAPVARPPQTQAAPRPTPAVRPAAAAPALPQRPRPNAAPAGAQRPVAKAAGPLKPAAPAPVKAAAAAPPRTPVTPTAAKPMPQSATRPAQPAAKQPLFGDSNVKEVMAALDGHADPTGETRLMPSPIAQAEITDDPSLTDTQVLRFLESRREQDGNDRPQAGLQADAAAESGISLLKPDDTGTRRALKEAVSHNDPVSFAVQLQWSVQPVELDKVPPLAIFSAYTLYSVEGSREGRKWYGLRLGFFNDAISAKQVAYYVRSEFTSVAVVPVGPQERERATEDNQRFAGSGAPRKQRQSEDNEFKLIDSQEAPAAATAATPPGAAASPAPAAAKPAVAAPKERESAGRVNARERRTPQTLEETLEILGANELAIDNARSESVSDTGVRHLRVQVQKNTPFSRLLERLSERVRKS